jgi:DNA-binding NarL/FixJ family response regulator
LFDVVVLDYYLLDAYDLALLATTRRLSPHSHEIITIVFMMPDVMVRAFAAGARCVMDKPVDMNRLARLALESGRVCERRR